jgi:hypothetical protein
VLRDMSEDSTLALPCIAARIDMADVFAGLEPLAAAGPNHPAAPVAPTAPASPAA